MVLLFYIVNGNIVPSELKVRLKSLKGTSVHSVTPLSSYFLVKQVQLEQGEAEISKTVCQAYFLLHQSQQQNLTILMS